MKEKTKRRDIKQIDVELQKQIMSEAKKLDLNSNGIVGLLWDTYLKSISK